MIFVFWPMAKHLRDFLQNDAAYENDDIHAGYADKPSTKGRVVEVTWDEENVEGPHQNGGTVLLWVDCMITNADRTPGSADEKLYALIEAVLATMFPDDKASGWPAQMMRSLGIAANVKLERVVSDAGTRVPLHSARIIIRIDYRR